MRSFGHLPQGLEIISRPVEDTAFAPSIASRLHSSKRSLEIVESFRRCAPSVSLPCDTQRPGGRLNQPLQSRQATRGSHRARFAGAFLCRFPPDPMSDTIHHFARLTTNAIDFSFRQATKCRCQNRMLETTRQFPSRSANPSNQPGPSDLRPIGLMNRFIIHRAARHWRTRRKTDIRV